MTEQFVTPCIPVTDDCILSTIGSRRWNVVTAAILARTIGLGRLNQLAELV